VRVETRLGGDGFNLLYESRLFALRLSTLFAEAKQTACVIGTFDLTG
jgi:hypothetical protein